MSAAEPARSPRPPAGELLFRLVLFGLCVGCVFPLAYTQYAPLQDLPQHLAAIRVLHDFDDPALRFARYFEVDLLRTQYLAYYLAADLLADVAGVERANELLIAAAMIATPLTALGLRSALGKDPRLALLCFPLAYNAHLVLGFFNFLSAIPLSLYGVTLAIRQRRSPSLRRGVGLSALALVCFYTHVVPFALLCLAIGLIGLSRKLKTTAVMLAPLVPSAIAALLWLQQSPAGQATATAASGADGPALQVTPPKAALAQTGLWLTDLFRGDEDRRLLWGWAGLCAAVVVLALAERAWRFARKGRAETAVPADPIDPHDALGWQLSLVPWLLAALSVALYFLMPTSYDWIWPIAQRFPLLAALWLVIALPDGRWLRRAAVIAAFVLSSASLHFAGNAFARFDRDEVGDFDAALAAIPPGQRVVGLIFDRHSQNVTFSPFIHFVAYYQARKGGAVMFTFADFPQSPFRFREQNRPPRVGPRWEWMPERVVPRRDLAFYDYALVRGGPGLIARRDSGFTLRYQGTRWSVYEHTTGQ